MKVKDHFLSQEEFEIVETNTVGVYKTYPIPANIEPYYDSTDYISHHQDSGSIKEKFYKFLQNFNLKYKKNILQKNSKLGSKVLDYGSGAGEFVKYIEQHYVTFGYEPNHSARKNSLDKISKTKIVNNLSEIKDEFFDVITLWHVFEHIENQQEILEEFYKKLTIQGKLIIAVPNPDSYDAKKYREYWAAYDVPRHVFHFSKRGMVNLMNNPQWKIKEIKPLLLDSFYICMLSEKYKKYRLFWLKGLLFGTISNFKAFYTGEYSSLIYVIEKK
jgi:2-polyprenyl-3-methyl-5-hydroxy-6-metoxy-1,4-benzoquinol methylase